MNARQNQYLEVAYNIGMKLCRDAIWAGNQCNWVGPSMEYMDGNWKTVHRAYGTELYSGTSGIGYFLSYLFSHTSDEVVRQTALGSFRQAISNMEQIAPNARIGFYTGWAGLLKALQTCGPLLKTDAFETTTALLLEALHECNLTEAGLDVLAGSAGAIPVLIAQGTGNNDIGIVTAKKIADHLISIAHKNEKGWSWNTLNPSSTDFVNNLTGFSHGTAGIGWVLIELYHATKEKKYHDAAQNAFAYERAWFSAEYGNWPDLRDNKDNNQTMASKYGSIAWCHGAPGIGLSRVRTYELLGDEMCKKEAEIAVGTTCNMINHSLQSPQTNFSLCHGIAGNAELLLIAGDSLKNHELVNYGQYIGDAGVELFPKKFLPWPCGTAGAGEVPGLMLGLAGIGFFYLRLYNHRQVPSILIPSP